MQSPNAVRGKWNVGRIINVYPGQDGRVRNVKVKTRDGEYQRPISKIAVIYPAKAMMMTACKEDESWRTHRGGECFSDFY